MNKLFRFLLPICLFLFSIPCWATLTLVQVKSNNTCSASSTCAVTVTSTGAGHIIVVGLIDGSNQTITSVAGGGTYSLCPNCAGGNSTTGYTDMAYTLNSTAGATSVTITHTAGSNNSIGVVWEYSFTGSAVSLDQSGSNLVTTNCTACVGTTLSLSGTNDVISTLASCGGSCTAISSPYTNDLSNPGGDTVGHNINTASGTAATFNQSPTSNIMTAAIAIKETTGAPPPTETGRIWIE